MKEENKSECCNKKMIFKKHHSHCYNHGGSGGAIYGLGVVGALFYFLQNATTTFGMVIIGIGKSIFWPAILMFKLLTYLHM
jgi:hypothetical protein